MARLFTEAVIYDKFQAPHNTEDRKAEINACDLVFVCVPTPSNVDGSCDISAVEEVVGWVSVPMCIKSTVPPGTTERLAEKHGKSIAFSPENLGERGDHPWREEGACGYVVIGGELWLTSFVARAYASTSRELETILVPSSTDAEMAKYAVNCFLAVKVTMANQFKDAAEALGANYDAMRALWARDPRVGESHTMVTQQRGYGGSCFPKDMKSLAFEAPGMSIIEASISYNNKVRRE